MGLSLDHHSTFSPEPVQFSPELSSGAPQAIKRLCPFDLTPINLSLIHSLTHLFKGCSVPGIMLDVLDTKQDRAPDLRAHRPAECQEDRQVITTKRCRKTGASWSSSEPFVFPWPLGADPSD